MCCRSWSNYELINGPGGGEIFMNIWKPFFCLFFNFKIFFNILHIWIFSTMKDPNIGQGSQIETLILIIKLREDYPTQGKELQSISCCCNWSILKRVHTIWNRTKPNHSDEIYFSTFMHIKFHSRSFLSADTMYTFGSSSAQAPFLDTGCFFLLVRPKND